MRANALFLAQKYFKDAEFDSDIVEGGFLFLDDVLEFTKENYKSYPNYEAFFKEKLIDYFNQLMEIKQEKSL